MLKGKCRLLFISMFFSFVSHVSLGTIQKPTWLEVRFFCFLGWLGPCTYTLSWLGLALWSSHLCSLGPMVLRVSGLYQSKLTLTIFPKPGSHPKAPFSTASQADAERIFAESTNVFRHPERKQPLVLLTVLVTSAFLRL